MLAMVCGPVGVEDLTRILDKRITASTYHDRHYYPFYGRLNGKRGAAGAWCSRNSDDRTGYLEVDMGSVHVICAVATQGGTGGDIKVTSYKLKLSLDGSTYNFHMEDNTVKVFQGNKNHPRDVVKNSLRSFVKARYVRFYPVTSGSHTCMSVEIFVWK